MTTIDKQEGYIPLVGIYGDAMEKMISVVSKYQQEREFSEEVDLLE